MFSHTWERWTQNIRRSSDHPEHCSSLERCDYSWLLWRKAPRKPSLNFSIHYHRRVGVNWHLSFDPDLETAWLPLTHTGSHWRLWAPELCYPQQWMYHQQQKNPRQMQHYLHIPFEWQLWGGGGGNSIMPTKEREKNEKSLLTMHHNRLGMLGCACSVLDTRVCCNVFIVYVRALTCVSCLWHKSYSSRGIAHAGIPQLILWHVWDSRERRPNGGIKVVVRVTGRWPGAH